MLKLLKEAGYGLTVLTAEGYHNILVQLIIKRKNLKDVLEIIEKNNPNAFISIQQVQSVKGGIFPPPIRKHYIKSQKKK